MMHRLAMLAPLCAIPHVELILNRLPSQSREARVHEKLTQ